MKTSTNHAGRFLSSTITAHTTMLGAVRANLAGDRSASRLALVGRDGAPSPIESHQMRGDVYSVAITTGACNDHEDGDGSPDCTEYDIPMGRAVVAQVTVSTTRGQAHHASAVARIERILGHTNHRSFKSYPGQ